MDFLAQIESEKYSNPIEFLNQLRQTTEPIGGGMEYYDNGEYVEYDVAVEAVKKAQQQLIDKAAEWFRSRFPNMSNEAIEKFKEDMKGGRRNERAGQKGV